METNVLIGMGLLLLTSGPPDVTKMPLLQEAQGICPDGTAIEAQLYDANPDDPEAAVVLFKREGRPVGALDSKADTIYVYADRKTYTLSEAQEKYASPCDLPREDKI